MLKVPVSDVEISVEFYEKKLGFQLDFVAKEYGWGQMKIGEVSVALYQPGMGGGNRQIGGSVDFHLSLAGNEFDEVATLMKDEGNLAGDMVHQGADGTTFIEIRDPDGNEIKIFRSK